MNSNTDTFVVLSKRDWLGGQTKPRPQTYPLPRQPGSDTRTHERKTPPKPLLCGWIPREAETPPIHRPSLSRQSTVGPRPSKYSRKRGERYLRDQPWSTTSSLPDPTWSWSQSSPSRKRVSQRNCARAHVPLNGYLKTNWKAPERALPSLQKDSKGDRYPLSPHMPPDEEHLFRSPPSTLLCRYYLKMGLCPNQIIKPI